MAPFWGPSLSSTWNSLYRQYIPIIEASDSKGAAATTDTTDTVNTRPSIGQILMSKRVRYAGTAVVAAGLFVLALRNYDRLASVRGWRSDIPSLTSNLKPNCPVAQLPPYDDVRVNWSQFAYTQYATNRPYLCNSVMIFHTLFKLGSKADRVLMYPREMLEDPTVASGENDEQRLLIKARDSYNVKLVPVHVQHRDGADSTWAESFTKLLAFNQTQYTRVLNVDSDATILQTMDELFLMPPCPVAMPRAYWLFPDSKTLSSQLMLIQPSSTEFDRVMKKMESSGRDDYDMEIVNQLYLDQAMILPHRPYDLLTGEFRGDSHEKYLGTDREEWNPAAIFSEAKYLHFSDWPVPKPWIPMSEEVRQNRQPNCQIRGGQEDCTARQLWNGFYNDFAQRRSEVCNTKKRKRQ